MAVAIPLVEPKDWHYPRVLSDIISPYIPLLYTPYILLCCAVLFVFVLLYMCYIPMYIYIHDTDTQRHRPYTPIPLLPHDTTQ